jgi:uncharacterized HAD superfamily protein
VNIVRGKTLYIDFDGVIHDYKKVEWPLFGEPIMDAQQAMLKLKRLNNKLVVFSSRAFNTEAQRRIMQWLDDHRIPYDEVTNIKGAADYIIDDRAVHFSNWIGALNDLKA